MDSEFKQRYENLQASMANHQVSNQLISSPASIHYFTGYYTDPGERFLLLVFHQDGTGDLYVNDLFPPVHLPKVLTPVVQIHNYHDGQDILSQVQARLLPGDSAIDKEWQSHFLLDLMALDPDFRPVNKGWLVDNIRSIKSLREQDLLRQASHFNDQAIGRLIQKLPQALSEKDMRAYLAQVYADLGQEGFSFEPIIAYGPNGADPHHVTSLDRPALGDSVVLDIGARYQGYASDMTRTVFYGQVSPEGQKVYETVLEANLKAIQAVQPGRPIKEVDLAARQVIEKAGYGPYFTHRTGHFIGQEVHEAGDVSQYNDNLIQVGQVFSIEPGIYLPGKLGVRIEDLIIVTEEGCEVINQYPKDLTVVPAQD